MGAPASEVPRVRVAALMTVDDRVVCVRHRAGPRTYHLLPGGGVRYRETIAQALEREILEETGLEIAVGSPLFINDTIDPAGTRHVINLTFAAEVTGGEITSHPADRRVESVDLVDPDSLLTLDLRPPIAGFILEALHSDQPCSGRYLGSLFAHGDS